MITVQEAEEIIFESIPSLSNQALNIKDVKEAVLQEDIYADRDFPPFDRIAMDGIAISSEAFNQGIRKFMIEGVQKAGSPQQTLSDINNCFEAMTGGVLPQGCDLVIPVEELEINYPYAVIKTEIKTKPWLNIHKQGSDYANKAKLLSSKIKITSPVWAVLATVGKTELQVSKDPKIAIVTTGDELVAVDQKPLNYQIRRSNAYALESALKEFGFNQASLHHIPDQKDLLKTKLEKIVAENDVLILSGGVSKGKFDFVPEVLSSLGVEKKIHKIKQKPGKPLWFGVLNNSKLVFGLPGNPVSALICCYRYVLPALQKMQSDVLTIRPKVKLEGNVKAPKDFNYFIPVKIQFEETGLITAKAIIMNGSGDLASLAHSDGFVEIQGPSKEQDGKVYAFYPWKEWI